MIKENLKRAGSSGHSEILNVAFEDGLSRRYDLKFNDFCHSGAINIYSTEKISLLIRHSSLRESAAADSRSEESLEV